MTSMQHLLAGALALALAAAQVASWIAMGAFFTRPVHHTIPRTAVSLLIGSGITSAILAVAVWQVSVRMALAADAITCVIALVAGRRELRTLLASIVAEIRLLTRASAWRGLTLGGITVFYWLNAFAPPRDGDVVRYHLAHIRQIIQDGRWRAIVDYHYALPFGWTLNYLPFEAAGIPEGAHMLNAIVVFVIALVCLSLIPRERHSHVASLTAALFVLHPAIVKAGTTAFADAYGMLVVAVSAVLVAVSSTEDDNRGLAAVTGFACWIGVQSRYQLIGFGVAATISFLVVHRRSRAPGAQIAWFSAGAALAVLAASPFFLMNLESFGNPVWPFFADRGANPTYGDIVAAAYHKSQTGVFSADGMVRGVRRLFTYRDVFPIPIVLTLALGAGWVWCRRTLRPVLFITTLFAILWLVAQPALYPRFALYFAPLALLLGIGILECTNPSRMRWISPVLLLSAALLLVADIAYSGDNLRYAVTGDTRRFHRYTWYYPVYEWIDRHTSPEARFAVIVWSGYSYYLDRPYRRADPWLSGEIDWKSVTGPAALDSIMAARKFDYIVYENRNWNGFIGGGDMMRVISDAVSAGSLVPVRRFRERLYTSRMSREFVVSEVYILRRAK